MSEIIRKDTFKCGKKQVWMCQRLHNQIKRTAKAHGMSLMGATVEMARDWLAKKKQA